MFFPKKEFPTLAMENALMDLGVTCRKLPDLRPEIEKDESEAKPIADTEPSLSGFTMKIAALILSQFKEVINHISAVLQEEISLKHTSQLINLCKASIRYWVL